MEAYDNAIVDEYASVNIAASPAHDHVMRLGAVVFWAVTIFYGAWLVWRAFLPLEIDPNEAWNAWQTKAAFGAGPLYPASDALITNNYPPLSYFIVGLLAKLTGTDLILSGRLVSLLGLGASAGAAAVIVRQLGGSRTAAGFGAAWFLATMVRFCPGYVGMDDPNFLALGVMAWGVVLFLRRYRTERSIDVAILVMVLAGFIKHSLIATPATALAWLWLEQDHRKALRATLVGALAAAAGLAACVAAFGWAFAEQLFLYKRGFSFRPVWEAHQLTMVALALACGVGATWRRRSWQARLVLTFLVAGLVVFCLGRAGDGVDINAAFELILATAIAVALALEDLGRGWLLGRGAQRVRWAVLAGLVATLLHAPALKAYPFWTSSGFHRATALRVQAVEAEVARVRKLPDTVSCSMETVCFEAGKPFVYDAFGMDERVVTGTWSRADLEHRLTRAGIRMEPGTDVAAWN